MMTGEVESGGVQPHADAHDGNTRALGAYLLGAGRSSLLDAVYVLAARAWTRVAAL